MQAGGDGDDGRQAAIVRLTHESVRVDEAFTKARYSMHTRTTCGPKLVQAVVTAAVAARAATAAAVTLAAAAAVVTAAGRS